ncbi:MAG: hypothetical protein CUN56_00175 [Phototrophicales bacterium]|nr:MAG: hypothetical protein CUN56_00175 [Phototrophicales bacterium]
MLDAKLEFIAGVALENLSTLGMEMGSHVSRNALASQKLAEYARAVSENGLKLIELYIAEKAAHIVSGLTPVVSGSLASAHAPFQVDNETYVAINPAAINPTSPERPFQYGPKVHEMGGVSRSGHRRDFYNHLLEEFGDDLIAAGKEQLEISLGVAA